MASSTEHPRSRRPGRDQELLANLAAVLDPVQPPQYLRRHMNLPDGWYWVPSGETRWHYLGRNAQGAAGKLAELLVSRA